MRYRDLSQIIEYLQKNHKITNSDVANFFIEAVSELPRDVIYKTSGNDERDDRNRKKSVMMHIRDHFEKVENLYDTQKIPRPRLPHQESTIERFLPNTMEYTVLDLYFKKFDPEKLGQDIVKSSQRYTKEKPDEIKKSGWLYKVFREYNLISKKLDQELKKYGK